MMIGYHLVKVKQALFKAVPVADNETLDLFPLTPTGISSDNEYPEPVQSCTPALVTSPNGNNSDSVYPQPCQSSTPQLGLPPTTETSSSSTDGEATALAKKSVRGINIFRLSHTLSSDTKTYHFCTNLGLYCRRQQSVLHLNTFCRGSIK